MYNEDSRSLIYTCTVLKSRVTPWQSQFVDLSRPHWFAITGQKQHEDILNPVATDHGAFLRNTIRRKCLVHALHVFKTMSTTICNTTVDTVDQMEICSTLLALCVRGTHRSPANSAHKGQWRGALICAWTNVWANNWDASDLRRHLAHYDVTVMFCQHFLAFTQQNSLNLWLTLLVLPSYTATKNNHKHPRVPSGSLNKDDSVWNKIINQELYQNGWWLSNIR